MLVLVVKIIRRAPPVRHREIQIAFFIRRRIKPQPGGRRHEQRIAPGPEFLRFPLWLREIQAGRVRGVGEDEIKMFAHGSDHFVFAVKKIKFRIGLADALVVGVIFSAIVFGQLPAIRFANGKHGVAVFGVAGNSRQRHHAGVAGSLNPAGRPVRVRMRELPVGHALHRVENGRRRHLRRKRHDECAFQAFGMDIRLLQIGRHTWRWCNHVRRVLLRVQLKIDRE